MHREILVWQAQTYINDIFFLSEMMLFSFSFLFSRRDLPAASYVALKNGEEDVDRE